MNTPQILQLFGRVDIKPTSQRMVIATTMLEKPQHLSADQVLAMVNARGERVSKATVYNTLSLFVKKGIIKQVLIDPSRVFYDSNTEPHSHFFNEDSGELTDISEVDMQFAATPQTPEGTVLTGVDVIVRLKNT